MRAEITVAELRQLIGKTYTRDEEGREILRFCFSKEWTGVIYRLCGEKRKRFGLTIPVYKSAKFEDFALWLAGAVEDGAAD